MPAQIGLKPGLSWASRRYGLSSHRWTQLQALTVLFWISLTRISRKTLAVLDLGSHWSISQVFCVPSEFLAVMPMGALQTCFCPTLTHLLREHLRPHKLRPSSCTNTGNHKLANFQQMASCRRTSEWLSPWAHLIRFSSAEGDRKSKRLETLKGFHTSLEKRNRRAPGGGITQLTRYHVQEGIGLILSSP